MPIPLAAVASPLPYTLGPYGLGCGIVSPAGTGRRQAIGTPNIHDLSCQSLIHRLKVVASLRPWFAFS